MRLLSLFIGALILAGCGNDEVADSTASSTSASQGDTSGRAIDVRVPCGDGWFETHADPANTVRVGRLAYDGEVLGYSHRRRYDDYLAKAPLAVEGMRSKPVTIHVLKQDEGSIGLAYGQIEPTVPLRRAADDVTLQPCSERPRTSFIGALLLDKPRAVVKLRVDLGPGGTRVLRLPSAPGGPPD